ncbi:MAG: uridine kinase [Fimbriimonas sp.]|jgi:uridine kinase|nr:uridine kinase [Fimbriimonadaceae bacterium]MCX6343025.1 uridine kinase [Fimbriimonadales bacterium]
MVVITIAGGTGSGKSTLAVDLSSELSAPVISIDDYYRPQNHRTFDERLALNFDEPAAIDHEFLLQQLDHLRRGQAVIKPVYDFSHHTRAEASEIIEPSGILIVEGLFAFAWEELRNQSLCKIFVDTPVETRFERRLKRDIEERGRDCDEVTTRFTHHVNPMHELHVAPTICYADLVVSGLENPARNLELALKQIHSAPIFM